MQWSLYEQPCCQPIVKCETLQMVHQIEKKGKLLLAVLK